MGTLQPIIAFRQSEMLGLNPFQNPQKVSFCRFVDFRIFAGAWASDVESPDAVFRDPFPDFLVGAWALQAQDQDGTAQLLAAGPGQQGASSQHDFLGRALDQDKRPIGVLRVASGPFGILSGLSFLKFVASGDDPVLGFTSFGAPSAVRDTEFDGGIERSAIDPGLAAGYDTFDEMMRLGWHGDKLGVSLACFPLASPCSQRFGLHLLMRCVLMRIVS
jgi:hypothetical protein